MSKVLQNAPAFCKLSTFIKLPFSIKIFVLSIFKWSPKTGLTIYVYFQLCTLESESKDEELQLDCASCLSNLSQALLHPEVIPTVLATIKTVICFCLFCCFTSQVNSYGHGRMASSPNHTFFLGKPEQAVNQYFVQILSLVTDNNPS